MLTLVTEKILILTETNEIHKMNEVRIPIGYLEGVYGALTFGLS